MQGQRRRSRLVIPVALLTVAVILVVAAFEFSSPPQTTQTQTAGSSDQVSARFAGHLDMLQAMNISGMEGEYLPNATFSLVSLGKGDYYEANSANRTTSDNVTTPKEIGVLIQGTFLSDFVIPHIANENDSVAVQGNVAHVNSTFDLTGTNIDGTNLLATMSLHVTYVKTGGEWLISNEVWTFTSINSH